MPRCNSYFEQEQELKAWWISHTILLETEAAAADKEAAERQALWDADMAACKKRGPKKPKAGCKGCGSPTGAMDCPMSAGVEARSSPGPAASLVAAVSGHGFAPASAAAGWTTVG